MPTFPVSPLMLACFVLVVVVCFVVVLGFYAWLDWTSRHDGPPSVRAQIDAETRTEIEVEPVLAVAPATPSSPVGIEVPIIAPATPPAARPPLPTRAPAARSRAFDPADHEQALTEALFVAAQAASEPGVTRLVPLRPIAEDTVFAPDVDAHIEQALAESRAFAETPGRHRAVMS